MTHVDIEQRRLCGSQLAKALHAALSSHVEWLPMRLSTLMQRVGAEYARLRDFKRDLFWDDPPPSCEIGFRIPKVCPET